MNNETGAAVAAAQPDKLDQEEQSAPGPDDVVTVTVGGKDKQGVVVTEIERGVATGHPDSDAAKRLRADIKAAFENDLIARPDQDSPTL